MKHSIALMVGAAVVAGGTLATRPCRRAPPQTGGHNEGLIRKPLATGYRTSKVVG